MLIWTLLCVINGVPDVKRHPYMSDALIPCLQHSVENLQKALLHLPSGRNDLRKYIQVSAK